MQVKRINNGKFGTIFSKTVKFVVQRQVGMMFLLQHVNAYSGPGYYLSSPIRQFKTIIIWY